MRNPKTTGNAGTSLRGTRFDKKSVNVQAHSFINFLIGLTAVLLVTFVVIELQTVRSYTSYKVESNKDMALEVNLDIFTIEKPKPQPQQIIKKKTPVIEPIKKIDQNKEPKIIDNDQPDPIDEPANAEPVEQPDNSKPSSDQPARKVDNATPNNYNVNAVTEVPLFPGCSPSLDSEERISCLNEKMARYIQRRFDLGLAREVEGKDVVSITVVFTIGHDGYPKDIQVRAPNPALEKEARRLIAGLPEMKPGKFDGAIVNTTYALPIQFRIK